MAQFCHNFVRDHKHTHTPAHHVGDLVPSRHKSTNPLYAGDGHDAVDVRLASPNKRTPAAQVVTGDTNRASYAGKERCPRCGA